MFDINFPLYENWFKLVYKSKMADVSNIFNYPEYFTKMTF